MLNPLNFNIDHNDGAFPIMEASLNFLLFCPVGITPNFSEAHALSFSFQFYLKECVLVAVADTISIQTKCPVPIFLCLNNYVKIHFKKKKKESYKVCFDLISFSEDSWLLGRLAYML